MVLTTLFAALALGQQPMTTVTVVDGQSKSSKTVVAVQDSHVSMHFDNASLKDVLNFLRKQKIDFVVDPDQYKDRKLSLSLTDVSSKTALDAIATALDSHWETVNGVRILKKGESTVSFQRARNLMVAPDQFKFDPQGLDKKTMEEVQKAMAEAQKAMADSQIQFRALNGDEMKKAMDEARKAMAESQLQFKDIDREEIRKAMEEARKAMADSKLDLQREKANNEALNRHLNNTLRQSLGTYMQSLTLKDSEGLLKSISSDQKEIQKKQGYLKISDLTDGQKKLLGLDKDAKGNIEITMTRDGETLKIKS